MSATINAEEGIHGIRSVCINPGEVETPILDQRPRPPSAADRALMVQPEDVAAAAVFAASMPARTCLAEILITPTDNNFYRAGRARHRRDGTLMAADRYRAGGYAARLRRPHLRGRRLRAGGGGADDAPPAGRQPRRA